MTVKLGLGNQYMAPVWLKQQSPESGGMLNTYGTWIDNIRIPKVRMGHNNTLVAACELRDANTDGHVAGIGVRLSTNGGKSWSSPIIELAYLDTGTATDEMNIGTLSYPLSDGTMFILYSYTPKSHSVRAKIWEMHSNGSDYTTWSTPTDISQYVVKTSNSDPANLPDTLKGTDSLWEESLVTGSCVADDDTLTFTGFYRYSSSDDVSHLFCITRSPAGTWSIKGGMESGGLNESEVQYDASGNLRVVARRKQISAYYTTTSSDGGATWADEATTGIAATETHPALISHPDNRDEMYLAAIHDTVRSNMTIWRSTDGGATWAGGNRVIFDGRASYPSIALLDSNRIILHFEAANNYSDYTYEYQMVKQAILNISDLQETQTGIWHCFNEKSSGAMRSGPSVPCHEGSDVRAYGNTSWTYGATGVTTNGSGLTLDNGRTSSGVGSAWAARSGPFTAQVVLTDAGQIAGGNTTQQIIGDRSTAGGWSVTVAKSTGILTGTLHDGTTTAVTCTHTTDIRSGTHSIAFVRDTANTKIYLVVDGVAGTKVTDTQAASIPATANAAMLGSQPNGSTNAVASGVVFNECRLDRKLVADADMLTGSETKRDFEKVVGFKIGDYPTGAPSTRSSCKFWVAQFIDPLRGMTGDAYKPFSPFYYKPERGQPVPGLVNIIDGLHLPIISTSRNVLVDEDTTVGKFLKARYASTLGDGNTGSVYKTASAATAYDFIQNTCDFTIAFTFRIDATSATSQYIFQNNGGSSGNPGFYILIGTDNTLRLSVTNGSARMSTASTKAFTTGTWYTVVYRGNGTSSNAVTMKWIAWSTPGVIPSGSWTTETLGSVSGGDGTWASTQPLIISGRNNTTQCAKWSFKDITIDNVALTDADVEAQMANAFYEPSGSFGSASYSRMGLGINLSLGLGARQ